MALFKSFRQTSGRSEQGNILFLILLAVALFAALSFAISQSSDTGSAEGVTKDKAELAAADMMGYGATAAGAYQRLRITQGISPSLTEFGRYQDDVFNAACTNTSCRLFHPNGGSLILRSPPLDARRDLTASAVYSVLVVGIQDVGSAAPDVALFVGGLTVDTCRAINKRSGVAGNIPTDTPLGPGDIFNLTETVWPVAGTFPDAGVTGVIGDEAGGVEIKGKNSFCYCMADPCDTSSPYEVSFVYVLQER